MHVHAIPVVIPSVTAGQWAFTNITMMLAHNAAVYIRGSYNHVTGAGAVQSV
jgi:hypothetical protein